jgi:hypothetical protein
MSEIILKTGKRKTTVSRAAIRRAVETAYASPSLNGHHRGKSSARSAKVSRTRRLRKAS